MSPTKKTRFASNLLDLSAELIAGDAKLNMVPILNVVSFWDTKDEQLVGNRVDIATKEYKQAATATSTSPITFTIPDDGDTYELYHAYCSLDTDVNAANRALNITAVMHEIISGGLGALTMMSLTAITITADQVGGFLLNEALAPNYWKNTNTALAIVADENPLPLTLEAGATVNFVYTNDQAGDILEAEIRYRKKTPTDES